MTRSVYNLKKLETMKKSAIILSLLISMSVGAFANDVMPDDNTAKMIKVNQLKKRLKEVNEKIKEEDKKRNQEFKDADPVSMERLNDEQDAKCLKLRSERVEIELELKEYGVK